jgi:hypothetical protein
MYYTIDVVFLQEFESLIKNATIFLAKKNLPYILYSLEFMIKGDNFRLFWSLL